jgi:hypothetical protein
MTISLLAPCFITSVEFVLMIETAMQVVEIPEKKMGLTSKN